MHIYSLSFFLVHSISYPYSYCTLTLLFNKRLKIYVPGFCYFAIFWFLIYTLHQIGIFLIASSLFCQVRFGQQSTAYIGDVNCECINTTHLVPYSMLACKPTALLYLSVYLHLKLLPSPCQDSLDASCTCIYYRIHFPSLCVLITIIFADFLCVSFAFECPWFSATKRQNCLIVVVLEFLFVSWINSSLLLRR